MNLIDAPTIGIVPAQLATHRDVPAIFLAPKTTKPKGPPMKVVLKKLWNEDEGQDLTEYALLLVLIALIAVASLQVAGQAVSDAFSNSAANLTTST
jgi:Flp pilus assembly pilin Flp